MFLLNFLIPTFAANQIHSMPNIPTALCRFTLSAWGNKTSNTRSEQIVNPGMWRIDFQFFLATKMRSPSHLSNPTTSLNSVRRLFCPGVLLTCLMPVNGTGRALLSHVCVIQSDIQLTGYSVQLCPLWPTWKWHLPPSADQPWLKRELRLKSS